MTNSTKAIFFTGLTLVGYGFLCRRLNLYFFWDSKIIGWLVLLIGLACYLVDLYKHRKKAGKRTLWVKLGIGFLLFGLLITPVVIFKLKTSGAYKVAIEYLKKDPQLKEEIGDIKGFGLIPTGSTQITIRNGSESGDATFLLTIRGTKKYKDITVNLKKGTETEWSVIAVE